MKDKDTPRTNMHVLDVQVGSAGYVVSAEFARELERDLKKAQDALRVISIYARCDNPKFESRDKAMECINRKAFAALGLDFPD